MFESLIITNLAQQYEGSVQSLKPSDVYMRS